MMTKVATCCYCGTRAALVLSGRERHELSCARCGAPLSRLKQLPVEPGGAPAPAATPARPATLRQRHRPAPLARRRRKSLARKVLREVWDIVEDLLD